MGLGATIWEKTHKKQVEKEKEAVGFTKKPAPAGEDRKIEKEDNTKRRKSLDEQIDKATE